MRSYFLSQLNISILSIFILSSLTLPADYTRGTDFPFAPAAGVTGSTAVSRLDSSIVAWATGFQNVAYGNFVDQAWRTPEKALNQAVGGSFDIVSLGRGGRITLTFENPIRNGLGFDFAIFENSFSSTFLEVAWVEVSSDGTNFVRFPNYSIGPTPVSGFGSIDPTTFFGLAGKYQTGFGTPFELEELALAYTAALANEDDFSSTYKTSLITNFPKIDLQNIRFIRLIDVKGDGNSLDSEGFIIYDPYPTIGSAGFDLDAIGVINEAPPIQQQQSINFSSIPHQLLTDLSVDLIATSSSGLPVQFSVLSGPATLDGTRLDFIENGTVTVEASTLGNTIYAPAPSVTRSFVIADEFQSLFIAPIPNLLTNTTDFPITVYSSSGLPIKLLIDEGPLNSQVTNPPNSKINTGSDVGSIRLRASQSKGIFNGITYAPAEDIFVTFDIVATNTINAPENFSQWQTRFNLGTNFIDSDLDGASNLLEFLGGTAPDDAQEYPHNKISLIDNEIWFELQVTPKALASFKIETSTNLGLPTSWTPSAPTHVETINGNGAPIYRYHMKLNPENKRFWRFSLENH